MNDTEEITTHELPSNPLFATLAKSAEDADGRMWSRPTPWFVGAAVPAAAPEPPRYFPVLIVHDKALEAAGVALSLMGRVPVPLKALSNVRGRCT